MADMNIKDVRASSPSIQKSDKNKVAPAVSNGTKADPKLYMNTDSINSVPNGGSYTRGKE